MVPYYFKPGLSIESNTMFPLVFFYDFTLLVKRFTGRRDIWRLARDSSLSAAKPNYRVTLSVAHLGYVNCFPESSYFTILLSWAEWQL